ncbi:hypothetical protein PV327_005068 [Microctonus hyperodae]|nr:hypothetical protein PV327_005068 [Microctonus hyperodae]
MDKSTKLIKSKSPSVEIVNVKKTNGTQGKLTKSSALTSADRSKSMTTLRKQEAKLSKRSMSDEKLKTPSRPRKIPPVPTDQTPVAQLCPMKSSTTTKSELTSFRTPVKRFFSDHIISQSTPDCFGSVQFETPRGKSDIVVDDEATIYEGENSNLTVGIRIRPMNFKELNDPKILSVVKVKGTDIIVDCESTQHTFHYDHCFVSYTDTSRPTHASQKIVFDGMVLPLVHNAFEGYNVCLFAYGQTGSGKSYSMMGSESITSTLSVPCDDAGIIPRFCYEIFLQAALNNNITTVEISYFEIYNEKIHDLLGNNSNISGSKRAPLKVREHPVLGPHVVDLTQHVVQNYEDLQTWLKVGNSQRATAATGMNEKSSRSHSIFSIILTQEQKDSTMSKSSKLVDTSRRSKINLVDLAGSERLSQTCASGDRLREGVSINKSLLILGKVIASLAESTNNRKRGFVPYRESVLTWLLKESLGGNSKTAMLATVSPSSLHLEETLATLRYACQARSIINRVRINEDPHDKLIRELKAEVLKLRGAREGYERQLGPRRLLDSAETTKDKREVQRKQREIDRLKEQLRKTEEQLSLNQKSRAEKLQVAEMCKNTELNFLRRCGIAIEIDFSKKYSTPCLVNLAADPMLSGTLLYLIPPGIVRIGKRKRQSKPVDILLDGPLVAPLHWLVRSSKKVMRWRCKRKAMQHFPLYFFIFILFYICQLVAARSSVFFSGIAVN